MSPIAVLFRRFWLRSYSFLTCSVPPLHFLSTSANAKADTDVKDAKESLMFRFLREDLGFPESKLVNWARQFPHLHRTRSLQNARKVLLLLKEAGYSEDQARKIVYRFPPVLCLTPENIKTKLDFFGSLGFKESDLKHFVCNSAELLSFSLKRHVQHVEYFQNILNGKVENFVEILKRNRNLLSYDLEERIKPSVNLLLESGIRGDLLFRLAKESPWIMNRPYDSVKSYIEFVKNMTIEESSNRFVDSLITVSIVGSIKGMEERFRVLKSSGLLKDEVTEIFRKYPIAFQGSTDKIDRVMEFLVQVVGLPPNTVVRFPIFLTYSLEKRIKPRFKAFKFLKGINPSFENRSFIQFLQLSNKILLHSHVNSSSHRKTLLEILGIKSMNTSAAGSETVVESMATKTR